MSWSVTDRFPSWGETGESPGAGFFYEGGDQVNEKHLDYLWNSLKGLEDDVQAALNDIDTNSDGIVDEAATVTSGGSLQGDLQANNGETIWDESANYIPQSRLQNDSVTVAGNAVSLGGSTAINHGDLGGISAGDHRSDANIVSTVEGAGTLNVNISGDADTVDGQEANDLGFSGDHEDLTNVQSIQHQRTIFPTISEAPTRKMFVPSGSFDEIPSNETWLGYINGGPNVGVNLDSTSFVSTGSNQQNGWSLPIVLTENTVVDEFEDNGGGIAVTGREVSGVSGLGTPVLEKVSSNSTFTLPSNVEWEVAVIHGSDINHAVNSTSIVEPQSGQDNVEAYRYSLTGGDTVSEETGNGGLAITGWEL
jgi:hypothetical protein